MKLSQIKQLIKSLIANALYYSGVLSYLKQKRLSNRAFVLMYHRVIPLSLMDDIHSTGGIVTEASLFARHLSWLREEFNVLSVRELIELFDAGREIPSASCLLTFDDGWRDNYEYAKPLLERHCVPAMIFLPYDYINNEIVFWQEELLARLLVLSSSGDVRHQEYLQLLTGLKAGAEKQSLRDYITNLKTKSYAEIASILNDLRNLQKDIEVDLSQDRYLDWEQVEMMSRSVISFGSHTLSHRILTQIDAREAEHEILQSKRLLDQKIEGGVDAIAYPNGNCSADVERMIGQAHYRIGFTTKPGYVSILSNILSLPRINIHTNNSQSKPLFLCHILNIF